MVEFVADRAEDARHRGAFKCSIGPGASAERRGDILKMGCLDVGEGQSI